MLLRGLVVVLLFIVVINSARSDDHFDVLYDSACCFIKQSVTKSLEFSNRAVDVAISNRNKPQLGKAYWLQGYLFQLQGKMGLATKYYHGAFRIYESLEDTESMIRLSENIGTLAMENGALDVSVQSYMKRLKLAEKTASYLEEAEACIDLGVVHRKKFDYENSFHYFLRAWKLTLLNPDTKNFDLMAQVANGIGLTYKYAGLLDSAIVNFQRATELAQSDIFLFHASCNMGQTRMMQGDFPAALEWLNKALNIGLEIGSDQLLIPALNNLGIVHYKLGDRSKADSLFRVAIEYNLMFEKNVKDESVESILRDHALLLKTCNNEDLILSYSYLDSLSSPINAHTRVLMGTRVKEISLQRTAMEKEYFQNTISIGFKEMEGEIQSVESRLTLEKYTWIAVLSLFLCGAMVYLGTRVRKWNLTRKEIRGHLTKIELNSRV